MASEVELDARLLRGLAHPLRVRLLGELRLRGPSTATRLAERLGESSGATSYHLRQLAAYGFVEEEPAAEGREKGPRERWWRAAHQMSRLRAAVWDDDSSMLAEAYLLAVLADNFDLARRAIHELAHLPAQWRQGTTLSDVYLRLTVDELQQLKAELAGVLNRYRHEQVPPADDAPAGARTVVLQVQAFRAPGGSGEEQP